MKLEDCVCSMPGGPLILKNLMWLKLKGIAPVLYRYSVDYDSIPSENRMGPCAIRKYVPDSIRNQEYWVISQTVYCEEHIILLDDFDCAGDTHRVLRFIDSGDCR